MYIKIFIIYIAFFTSLNLSIKVYLFYYIWMAFLKADKTSIVVLFKYIDLVNIFFFNFANKLLEYNRMNNHIINLIKDL